MVRFNKIGLRNEFIDVIREGFANYYDLLKTEVQVESEEQQEASYPCCIVSIVNPISDQKYDDSSGSFRKVRLSLECDLCSKQLDDFSLGDSIDLLSEILIQTIITKYPNFVVTRNSLVPYRTDVKRLVVDFACTYDIENKIIYSN